MSDELVKRLLDWPYQGETMAHEAADRIEALTAERDAAYARGYSDAETEISKSALGQRNDFLHSQYANAADHIKVLTAERDRLQSALRHIVTYLAEPTVASEDTLKSLRGDLRFVGRVASAALKGESHE